MLVLGTPARRPAFSTRRSLAPSRKAFVHSQPSHDALQLYLAEIRTVRLLTKADEQRLGFAMLRGREANVELAARSEPLDGAVAELRAVVAEGELARDQMVRANLPLVVYIARRQRGTDLPLLDLIQEGNVGLLRAVDKFDPRRGFRFSTHAVWWIRQAIQTGVARGGGTVRLPEGVRQRIMQVRRAQSDLALELAREPTNAELCRVTGMGAREMVQVLVAGSAVRSLDEPVHGDVDGSTFVSDVLVDSSSISPIEHVVMVGTSQEVTALLAVLDDRERAVVSMRFGLDHRPPCTLREVGAQLGITPERARQIEARAIRKLRRRAVRDAAEGA